MWNDPRTIRYGIAKNLCGYKEIEAFRAGTRGPGPRTLSKTVFTTYGRDFAVASTLTYLVRAPGKVGRQMQTAIGASPAGPATKFGGKPRRP
jgi:hypothetical protein